MENTAIQRLYSDGERVIVYEPLYREQFSDDVKIRIRIVKPSSNTSSQLTWESIRRGEYLGSGSFDSQVSHMKFLEVIIGHNSQEVERVFVYDPDQEVYRAYCGKDNPRLGNRRLDDISTLKSLVDDAMDRIRNSQPIKVYHTPEEIIRDEELLGSFR